MVENKQVQDNFIQLTDSVYYAVLLAIKEQRFEDVKGLLSDLHYSDIATLIERLPRHKRIYVLKAVDQEVWGKILYKLSFLSRRNLLTKISVAELNKAIGTLESDDMADVVQSLSAQKAKKILKALDLSKKQLVTKYGEDTAGGLMQLEIVSVPQRWTVKKVLRYLRENKDSISQNISTIYVVNRDKKLRGSVSLTTLVKMPLSVTIKEIMRQKPNFVYADSTQRDLAQLFEKYDLYDCPVVNEHDVLLGNISVDDVLGVVIKESGEEYMLSAGLLEDDDLFSPIRRTTRKRFPWLLVNLFTAILASIVIAMFSEQIDRLVVLAVLMPIVASMGGNAGSQTVAVTIRGLAKKQITLKNAFYLLRKEVLVGGFNGTLLALVLAVGVVAVYGDWKLAGVIFAATILNHLFAAFAGNVIPIALERMGKDPAVASTVLVTTVTDVGGFFSFLGLAAYFLL